MATHPWFQTSIGFQWAHDGGQTFRAPAGLVHAKSLGTSTTACGLRCDTWPKFWHLQYRGGQPNSCRTCDFAAGH